MYAVKLTKVDQP